MIKLTKTQTAQVLGGATHRADVDHLGSYNFLENTNIEFQDGDDVTLRKRPGRS